MAAPGTTLGDRYSLKRQEWSTPLGPVWVARDQTLDRAVLVQTLEPSIANVPAAVRALQRSAARAAQVTHPGLLQVFDIGADPTFIVFEHAAGGRLADKLRAGPMRPTDAVRATLALARGLEALHERGAAHGSLSPATVLFDLEGRAKIMATGAADAGRAAGNFNGAADQPPGYRAPEQNPLPADADRYALAALLFHMLTGTPPQRGPASARAVRRGVPAGVDTLLQRALSPAPAQRPTLDEFIGGLAPFARVEIKESKRRRRGIDTSEFGWLLPVLLVLAIAAFALTVGVQMVQDFVERREAQQTEESPPPRAPRGKPIEVRDVEDFDPMGNGEEHPEDTGSAIDGDPRTSWNTLQYGRDVFDGRKDGVGLLFEFDDEQALRRARVQATLPGWRAEFRIADARPDSADDMRAVERFTADTETTVTFPSGTSARYVLLWITRLTDNEGGSDLPYSAEVAEVEFFA